MTELKVLIANLIKAKQMNDEKALVKAAQEIMSFDRKNPFVVEAKYVIVAKAICDKI